MLSTVLVIIKIRNQAHNVSGVSCPSGGEYARCSRTVLGTCKTTNPGLSGGSPPTLKLEKENGNNLVNLESCHWRDFGSNSVVCIYHAPTSLIDVVFIGCHGHWILGLVTLKFCAMIVCSVGCLIRIPVNHSKRPGLILLSEDTVIVKPNNAWAGLPL